MLRIEKILQQPAYWEYIKSMEWYEKDREYCRHDMNHFLDTARIAYIYSLEHKLPYTKEVIYAMGLLHDIGKWVQYKDNTPHEKASAQLAKPLLTQAGFTPEESKKIRLAIKTHGKYNIADNSLNYLLWYADKKSRKCYCCSASESCNWSADKKNNAIVL